MAEFEQFDTEGEWRQDYSPPGKLLSEIEEQSPDWLIENWIPRREFTVIAGDGGVGKSTLCCDIVAAVTSHKPCFLEPQKRGCDPTLEDIMPDNTVLIFSAEDDPSCVLRPRLSQAGANLARIVFVSEHYPLDSTDIGKAVLYYHPALVVIDPYQSFLPDTVNINARNEMRGVLDRFTAILKTADTTAIIVAHTNKREGSGGRNRLSDSSELWDRARSVIVLGQGKRDGTKYISHEKCNYAPTQQTILFGNQGGSLSFHGFSDKKDIDFQNETRRYVHGSPVREECGNAILTELHNAANHSLLDSDLKNRILEQGYTQNAYSNAKRDLSNQGKVITERLRGYQQKFKVSLRD